jgi:hypothetical protein
MPAALPGGACLLLILALQPGDPIAEATESRDHRAPVSASHAPVTHGHASTTDEAAPVVTPLEPLSELARLSEAVEAGRVRVTVADIRRYLQCSQARALELRRRVADTTERQEVNAITG